MKKIFLLTLILLLSINQFQISNAQTKSSTPEDTITEKQINELKSKIASKVAELNLVEKRGVLGKVAETSDTQIALTDFSGNTKNIDVDELTKFYSSSSDNFGISDIKKGQTIGVLGLYNKQSLKILAREVNEESTPEKIVYGIIVKKDEDNFELTLFDESKNKSVFEVSDITKTYSFSQGELVKSGFSKTSELSTIIAVGSPDKQIKEKYLASRIIILPNINLAQKLDLSLDHNPSSTESSK